MFSMSSAFFQNDFFSENYFRNTFKCLSSNNLYQGQDRHSVGPGPGPDCLQRVKNLHIALNAY